MPKFDWMPRTTKNHEDDDSAGNSQVLPARVEETNVIYCSFTMICGTRAVNPKRAIRRQGCIGIAMPNVTWHTGAWSGQVIVK